jgi:hypothetical protein
VAEGVPFPFGGEGEKIVEQKRRIEKRQIPYKGCKNTNTNEDNY